MQPEFHLLATPMAIFDRRQGAEELTKSNHNFAGRSDRTARQPRLTLRRHGCGRRRRSRHVRQQIGTRKPLLIVTGHGMEFAFGSSRASKPKSGPTRPQTVSVIYDQPRPGARGSVPSSGLDLAGVRTVGIRWRTWNRHRCHNRSGRESRDRSKPSRGRCRCCRTDRRCWSFRLSHADFDRQPSGQP